MEEKLKDLVTKEEHNKLKKQVEELKRNESPLFIGKEGKWVELVAWASFVIGLVPFFPYKTFISIFGIYCGYLFKEKYKGSSRSYRWNIALLIFRLLIYMLFVLLGLFVFVLIGTQEIGPNFY